MHALKCKDPVMLDEWHVIAAMHDVAEGRIHTTQLLGEKIAFLKTSAEDAVVWWFDGDTPREVGEHGLPVKIRYGYIWTSLGTPQHDIFPIPETVEADRRNIHAATFGVNISAPRAIENFLDMGHFPYVHTHILGEEPHTEVKEYTVEVNDDGEIWASDCEFWQPMAAAASDGGAVADYLYRVPHPICSVLYKSSPGTEGRMDVIAVFLQPMDEEHIRAHMFLSLIDNVNTDRDIRLFQQTIFAQDKPILENQIPKKLPLDPRAETPIRADKSAITYRRWLDEKGLNYGVIRAHG